MTTTTEIKTVHSGIEITYDESANRWRYELRGKERSAETLANAKEAIDAPVPTSKVPFVRFQAYRQEYGNEFEAVTVTSIAEKGWRSTQEFWTSDSKKSRTKVASSNLYAHTPENTAIIAQIGEVRKQMEALQAKELSLKKSLAPIETKDWE